MKVYFISGMGADSRVFKHIRLPDGYEIVHLDWIPAFKNESLSSYSKRISEKIDPVEKFALVGLSMGGMMAAEIAKQFTSDYQNNPVATILISSVPTYKHLPSHFKISRLLKLHKIVPVRFLKSASLLKRFFAPDKKEDFEILTQVIKDSDPVFIRWAMQAVLEWKNETLPQPMWQIHGTKDNVLPLRFTRPTHIIKGGNHLMIMNKAGELNKLIDEVFQSIESKR